MVKYAAFLVICFLLVGCNSADSTGTDGNISPGDSDIILADNIVTTIFPLYDWTRVILGSNPGRIGVRYLLESGVDLHFYTPSIQDIAAISASDLFLWVGGKSDDWVLNAMANPANENRRNIPVMRMLTIHETLSFPVDGVIGEVGGEDCCGGEFHDEHVWLSLPFAIRFVERIADEIARLDPENADYYTANAAAYIKELYELHSEFIEMVENSSRDTILVIDRFPFLYLTVDYGLNFFSAFDGCFAATEISFQRQAELANALNELELDVIIIIDNHSVAESVARAAGRDIEIMPLQDFQTVSTYHIEQGLTYLGGMRQNLEALRVALR
ncbi:MAG: metal ABC transporter substrate-binding protein [Defluviitaleaceae bacterium]|nr:metal ABC transporter substrate-binding protein [Defluviitaleaceae bacterium]MCL2262300.1 metal ABC transporter substrate-binding protein [Defluviitaleaceae bacterium]